MYVSTSGVKGFRDCISICSVLMMRSTTWPKALLGVSAARSGKALSARTTNTVLKMRISPPNQSQKSVCGLKHDMNHCRKVHRVTVRKRGPVFDLLCSTGGGLVQTVAQTLDDSIHVHFAARCRKHHVQQYLAFQVQLERLCGIHGPGFSQDHDRLDCRGVVHFLLWCQG